MVLLLQGPNIIVHQPEEILLNMNEWCKEQHGKVRNMRKVYIGMCVCMS